MQDRVAGNWLEEAVRRLADARVTVFGDFCLDAYWLVDPDESELSVETGLPVRRVRIQRYSPGGAGNVAVNLTALGMREVRAIGLVGDDAFGRLLTSLLQERGVDTAGLLRCQDDWQTMVFAKPHVAGEEQHRMDFGGFNEVRPGTAEALAAELDRAAASSTAVILNQQVPAGTSPPHVIERLLNVVAAHPRLPFVVDSRHRAELYRAAFLKVNAHEAARLCGEPRALTERVPDEAVRSYAAELFRRTGRPVFVTRGERGILAADAAGIEDIPGIQILEQTDPVGAGDTVVAALAAAVGSGADARTAARLANIAASVTVRKLYTTGMATPEEVLAVGPTPDYVYSPELADDPRKARIVEGTEFEIVRDLPAGRQAGLPAGLDVRHVIFDHDGTLSTLRQGWEAIMEPMMVRAVLGPRYEDADEALYHKVLECVRSYINRTTGVQTLVQMQGLVEMVRRFGCVPEDEVADAHAYKAIYDVELRALVERRTAKMARGELNAEDFQIKGARAFLERLHAAGLRLYLVSGTDTAEVEAEARALGYAHLFEGGIFGAVGDVRVEAKRIVLDRLIRQEGLGGRRLATFGDGPVEMRETRKREGLAVGVASDEVRRFGLNLAKRSRLIRGGADLIIPDFTQAERLLRFLAVG